MKRFLHTYDPVPLHVIGKCPDPVWPTKKISDVWKIFGRVLREFETEQKVRTRAFVLMNNHYHWLCSVNGESQVSGSETNHDANELFTWFHEAISFDFVHSLQMEHIFMTGEAPPPLFEGPPKLVKLDHVEAYRQSYAYIYRNPVRAGIVELAEHYPYSTLPYILGRTKKRLPFTCHDEMHLIHDTNRVLAYINRTNEYEPEWTASRLH